MPVRIIFRGLALFEFGKDGQLIANLLNDQGAKGVHNHEPQMRVIGRAAAPVSRSITGYTINLNQGGGGAAGGVVRDPTFNDHVPSLRAIDPAGPTGKEYPSLVAARVVVPEGRLHVSGLVTWPSDRVAAPPTGTRPGQPQSLHWPAQVRFVGSNLRGHMANECTIDTDWDTLDVLAKTIGEPSPAPGPEPVFPDNPIQPVTTAKYGAANATFSQQIEPDWIEVLVTNFAPQREYSVPWSLHYQWMFRLRGFAASPLSGYDSFAARANGYGPSTSPPPPGRGRELDEDLTLFPGVAANGYPFPYIHFPTAYSYSGPRPLQDPFNRPICPQGQE